MNNINDLIPKDKFDNSNINKLEVLTDDEISPILLPLLEWIQDYNWPVSRDILPILAAHQKALVPFIVKIMNPEEVDDIWKYWIIACLLPLFDEENVEPILPFLKRIAEYPTKSEREEEVDQAAIDFFSKKKDI